MIRRPIAGRSSALRIRRFWMHGRQVGNYRDRKIQRGGSVEDFEAVFLDDGKGVRERKQRGRVNRGALLCRKSLVNYFRIASHTLRIAARRNVP